MYQFTMLNTFKANTNIKYQLCFNKKDSKKDKNEKEMKEGEMERIKKDKRSIIV